MTLHLHSNYIKVWAGKSFFMNNKIKFAETQIRLS
jgi:hypothetical protein